MADYYPVLARAVSRLPDNNGQARQEIYERARAIVLEELRKQDPKKIASEQAQLEAAIFRLESESSIHQTPPPRAPAARAPAARAPMRPRAPAGRSAPVAAPRRTARSYLAGILRSPRPQTPPERKPKPPPPAQSRESAASGMRKPDTTDELGGMLNSLGTMLFGTAFLVAVLAITGVVYVRGLVWVAAGVIAYPVLLVLTAIVFSLLIIVPRAVFHSASALSAFGFLSRLIYSTSRRVF
jgi:hypothetical protein